jgi:hypothetical protein
MFVLPEEPDKKKGFEIQVKLVFLRKLGLNDVCKLAIFPHVRV